MSDLKCCPFCGGEAEVGLTNQHDKLFIVGCNTPMCYGNINHFTMVFVSKESAINTWNTRTPMANIVEKLEEKTEFLKDCTKYGNESAEQQEKSYSTMMMYEVADLVDDLIDIVKQEINNGFE